MCGSRKYPYPHHGGNWNFQRGGGVKSPGNSRGVGGLTVKLSSRWFSPIQYRPTAVVVRKLLLADFVERSEVRKGFAKELFPPSARSRP